MSVLFAQGNFLLNKFYCVQVSHYAETFGLIACAPARDRRQLFLLKSLDVAGLRPPPSSPLASIMNLKASSFNTSYMSRLGVGVWRARGGRRRRRGKGGERVALASDVGTSDVRLVLVGN